MPANQMKQYVQDPRCSICNRSVRGWSRTNCDNCGSTVCRRHRPLFVNFWQCPACQQRQQQFMGTQPQQSQPWQQNMAQSLTPPQSPSPQVIQAATRKAALEVEVDRLFAELWGD